MVTIALMRPSDQELRIQLMAPDGHMILLAEGFGYEGYHYQGTVFKDNVSAPIFQGSPPFTGEIRPMENIGYLNNGQNGNGTWKLLVLDMNPGGNAGALNAAQQRNSQCWPVIVTI